MSEQAEIIFEDDEKWIDLSLLTKGTYIRDGKTIFYYQFPRPCEYENDTLHTQLRIALRAVGKKITKVVCHYEKICQPIQIEYHTDITEEEEENMTKLHNNYCSTIFED
jgi:hypothetical protein